MKAFLVKVGSAMSEEAIAVLWEAGTLGIEERGAEFVAYFEDATGIDALRALLPEARIEPFDIPDVDWVARFRENFRAFGVGGFWITPEWDAEAAPPNGSRRLVVDPGRAFGTGTHESTSLCLEALEALASRGPLGHVLDIGTGSGILAVAARLLGARSATGGDNDPESIVSAREHGRLNGTAIHLALADGGRPFRAGRFDTVLANITAPLLIERARELSPLPGPAGRLILAGLLAEERGAVRAAYADFPVATEHLKGEWASLVLERR